MNKIVWVLVFLFLPVLFSLNSMAQDNKELLDHIQQWAPKIEPTLCGDDKRCYCFDLTPKFDNPRGLRYTKCQFCPIEVQTGHILLAFTSWDCDGKKVDEGRFINWKMDGLWTSWHPNGVKQAEGYYKNGKENGSLITWHDNGQIAVQGSHKDGMEEGEWCFWDKTGKLTKTIIFSNGKPVSKEEFK